MRNGVDTILVDPHGERPAHTMLAVYSEMMLTVARVYHSAPNVLEMTLDEIAFFYDGIRGELKERTKAT